MPLFNSGHSNTRRRRNTIMRNQGEVYEKHLEEQVNEGNSALSKAEGKAKKLRSCLMEVAEKVCDNEYSNKQLGGPNQVMKLSDTELRDFIIQNFYDQRTNMMDKQSKLQVLYKSAVKDKETISQGYLKLKQEKEELEKRVADLEYEIQHMVTVSPSASGPSAGEKSIQEDSQSHSGSFLGYVSDSQQSDGVDEETVSESISNIVTIDAVPYDLNQIRQKMDQYQNIMLKVLGDKGSNETGDIIDDCFETGEFSNEARVRRTLGLLKDNGLVGDRKHPAQSNAQLNFLTELGQKMYEYIYKKKPCKDEIHKLCAMHDNIDHAYCIKQTCKLLEKINYTNICMDNSKNVFEVAHGKRYVPDIVAEFNGRKTFWEVERGNHHDADFFEKLDKAAVVTGGCVYVIGDNSETKEHLKSQINKYILEKRKEKSKVSFDIYLGTIAEINNSIIFQNVQNRFHVGPRD